MLAICPQQDLGDTGLQFDHNEIMIAARLLREGKLVAFPTETVYGLGVDACNPQALSRLFAAKGRPLDHPVIVHLASAELMDEWAGDVPEAAQRLAAKFWPGPMTLILRRAPHVLDQVTGGQNTVGLRVPNHAVARALLSEFGGGVAAPSANKFGRISPTRAEDVRHDLGDAVSMVLDGGPCAVGIESSIIDLSGDQVQILRPGMISPAAIYEVIGACPKPEETGSHRPNRAPGTLPHHYAPNTPLRVLPTVELVAAVESLGEASRVAALTFAPLSTEGRSHVIWRQAHADPHQYARALYSTLRELDGSGVDLILVEQPPVAPDWLGVLDRLRRASH